MTTTPGTSAAGPDAAFAARLADACAAVTELAAAAGQLDDVPADDVAAVMGELTTMVGQLDGLRVGVTAQVRARGLYRRRGAADVAGWLRGDARTADAAASLFRLAASAAGLPQITALLRDGQVSLAQAGTACWQITQLPPVITRPDQTDPGPGTGQDEQDGTGQDEQDGTGQDEQDGTGQDGTGQDEPDGTGPDEPDGTGEDAWAGLWRGGDLHAAADALFADFLPGMDPAQLRVLGAHLREAADAQDRARDDYNTYAARSLRISRTLGGTAHLTGHLHPEAAEQILAAFEELGAKTGPDDTRTKPQRWADALAYLTSLSYPAAPAPATPDPEAPGDGTSAEAAAGQSRAGNPADGTGPGATADTSDAEVTNGISPDTPGAHGAPTASGSGPDGPGAPADREPDDDEPCPDGGHGHPHPADPEPAADREPSPASAGPGTGQAAAGPGVSAAAPAGLRRPRVIVTASLSTLLGAPLAPGAVLGAGTPITAETARRLACDADIIRLITTQAPGSPPGSRDTGPEWDATAQLTRLLAAAIGQLPRPLGGPSAALDIGRQSQSWTPRQRDALYAQYGGRCARAGCTRRIDVIHHIIHWLFDGKTRTSNGAPVCLYDHWLVHEGGWRISKDPSGTLTFIPPPPGWQPGTIYRRGKPIPETSTHPHAA